MIIDSPIVSGSLASSSPFTQVGNVTISGSLTVTGSINMSGSIASASQATSASYANSASYSLSSSYAATASYAINSTAAANATSASYAATASYANAFTVGGTITAQTLVVQTITSSVEYSSGSNVFGNSVSNTHQFTGSVSVSGSMNVNANSLVVNTNGTVSIGNTNSTYNLDVTGTGRFTGALTGTTATFSGLLSANNQLTVGNGVTAANSSINFLGVYGVSYQWNLYNDANGFTIYSQAGVNALRLNASTGAATFSSSVQALGGTFENAAKDALVVSDSRTQAAGVGGSILFKGVYTNLGSPIAFGRIGLEKQNSTTADYSFNLAFYTSPNGGTNPNPIAALKLNYDNTATFSSNIGIGGATPRGYYYSGANRYGINYGGYADIFALSNSSLYIGANIYYDNGWYKQNANYAAMIELTASNGDIYFYNNSYGAAGATSPNNTMTIKASGNVLIGTTTDNGNGILQASGNITIGGNITNYGTGTGTYTRGVWYYNSSDGIIFDNARTTDSSSGTGRTVYFTWRGGPTVGGGVQLQHGTNAWAAYTSDARLKTIVANIENGLEAVMKLNPIKYKWTKELKTSRTVLGFTAQNVGEAIPEAMFNSWKDDELGDVLSYYQEYLTPYLVKAIQELSAQNQELNDRLNKLEKI